MGNWLVTSAVTGRLAIVKRTDENYKRVIYAQGEAGKGATFRIYLPV